MKYIAFGFTVFLLTLPVLAENCEKSEQKIWVNVQLSSDIAQNDFNGKNSLHENISNTITLPLVEGWLKNQKICIRQEEFKSSATYLSKDSIHSVMVYLATKSDLWINLGEAKDKISIEWQANIYASNGSLAFDDAANMLPACLLQSLNFTGNAILNKEDSANIFTTNAKTQSLNACQGSQEFYSTKYWPEAKVGNTNVWNLSLSFLKLPSDSEPKKTFGEKTKQFFDSHPLA